MSLPTHPAPSQAIRCGNRNHKANIARQRKYGTATPRQQAEAIAAIVRKRISDQQPVPDLGMYRLDDQTWSELMSILTADELSAVADACRDDYSENLDGSEDEPSLEEWTAALEDDAQLTPSDTAPLAHVPSWRDHEPAIVHSLKWHDTDGIEHLHVVRADDLDEALRHVMKVKVYIKAAQLKAQKASEAGQEKPASERQGWCPIHNVQMKERTNARGKWFSHALDGGGFCKGN